MAPASRRCLIAISIVLLVLTPVLQGGLPTRELEPERPGTVWEIPPLFGKVPPPVTLVLMGACLIILTLWRSRHNQRS